MNFNFISPQNIYFGCGKIDMLTELVKPYSSPIMLVISKAVKSNSKVSQIIRDIESSHKVVTFDNVSGEPTENIVNECTRMAKDNNVKLIISIGGGSVIDTAKATAGFATNNGKLTDYIEGVGIGKVLDNMPIDHIAIPTTSGTGSEMTKNAVIKGEDKKFKRSFRHNKLVPVATIIDPELSVSVPRSTTAYSGMDAITQLIESYISKKSNPFTDALALDGLKKAGKSLLNAYNDGENIEARTNMAYASMISGMCLANSGLGAVHGIAAGLGAVLGIPHGMACSILLPHVIKLNGPHIKEKSASLCIALTGSCTNNHQKDTNAIIDYIDNMIDKLNIPKNFKDIGITKETALEVIKYSSSSNMGGNPYPITQEDILGILV